jgi:hypothetical protein
MTRSLFVALLVVSSVEAGRAISQPSSSGGAVFVAYYWRTVTPAPGTTTDWTHLRIFRLRDAAAADALGAGLDAATARVVPDEAQRKANGERSASMRDLVRREVWTELH